MFFSFLKSLSLEINKVFNFLLFEERCFYCKKRKIENFPYFCNLCLLSISPKPEENEIKIPYIDGYKTFSPYNGVAKEVIRVIKFKNVVSLARLIGVLAYPVLEGYIEKTEPDIITIVPPHPLRYWFKRGFNPVREFLYNTPLYKEVSEILKRKWSFKPPLASVKEKSLRKKLIKEDYMLKTQWINKLENKKILVIDDILTTGATAETIGFLLKSVGVEKVFWFAFFRG